MKPQLSADFSIHVRHKEIDEEPEYAPFYRGIYDVTLNSLVTVMFIPEFTRTPNNWPPELPENIDEVESIEQARLFTAGLNDYVVTPDASLAGQQEVIPTPLTSGKGLIFYVSPEQFQTFSQELPLIEAQTISVYEHVCLSKVKDFKCIDFICSQIIPSKNFSRGDLKILQQT